MSAGGQLRGAQCDTRQRAAAAALWQHAPSLLAEAGGSRRHHLRLPQGRPIAHLQASHTQKPCRVYTVEGGGHRSGGLLGHELRNFVFKNRAGL